MRLCGIFVLLFCPLFTSGASFSIAHEYSVRNLNWEQRTGANPKLVVGVSENHSVDV